MIDSRNNNCTAQQNEGGIILLTIHFSLESFPDRCAPLFFPRLIFTNGGIAGIREPALFI